MFSAVGTSVAMGNAQETVKGRSDLRDDRRGRRRNLQRREALWPAIAAAGTGTWGHSLRGVFPFCFRPARFVKHG
ncbi:MAG: hypothetical protein ACLTYW_05090 [Collinsella sp.]